MTKEDFDLLEPGDIIGHIDLDGPLGNHSWIVSEHCGDRVILVATAEALNPAEWEIVWTKEARD
jgi:hypothetical protein